MASEDASTAASAEVKEAPIEDASRVRADVRAFVMTHADHAWSGRAVARVFHGIGDDKITAFLCFCILSSHPNTSKSTSRVIRTYCSGICYDAIQFIE